MFKNIFSGPLFEKTETPQIKVLYSYDVKTDITAYELYLITHLAVFFSESHMESWYQALPDNCKRHLKPNT